MATKRVSFDFSPEAYAQLEELCVKTNAVTKADVVRNALRLYATYLARMEEGYDVLYTRNGQDMTVFFEF